MIQLRNAIDELLSSYNLKICIVVVQPTWKYLAYSLYVEVTYDIENKNYHR